jgi:hypothetical protein
MAVGKDFLDLSSGFGPNMRRLAAHKMALDAVPRGGGLPDALRFLQDKDAMVDSAKASTKWVKDAIAAVKQTHDNPFGNDDEAIAGELLRRIGERNAESIAEEIASVQPIKRSSWDARSGRRAYRQNESCPAR